jgi:hypothetical protein
VISDFVYGFDANSICEFKKHEQTELYVFQTLFITVISLSLSASRYDCNFSSVTLRTKTRFNDDNVDDDIIALRFRCFESSIVNSTKLGHVNCVNVFETQTNRKRITTNSSFSFEDSDLDSNLSANSHAKRNDFRSCFLGHLTHAVIGRVGIKEVQPSNHRRQLRNDLVRRQTFAPLARQRRIDATTRIEVKVDQRNLKQSWKLFGREVQVDLTLNEIGQRQRRVFVLRSQCVCPLGESLKIACCGENETSKESLRNQSTNARRE